MLYQLFISSLELESMNDLTTNILIYLGNTDNGLFFGLSIIPYAIFLYYLIKNKILNNIVKLGFSLTIVFVGVTIIFSILSESIYGKTLVEVDMFHGAAELFLTISDLVILYGFIKLKETIEVKNS